MSLDLAMSLRMGTKHGKHGGGPPSYTGPLDLTATPAVVAYGQRALSAALLGSAIYTIRRDSDNTTQSFNSGASDGTAPVAAISAFIGAGNGLITIWNDQGAASVNLIDTPDNKLKWSILGASIRPGIGGSPSGSAGSLNSLPTQTWTAGTPLTLFSVLYVDPSDTAGGSAFNLVDTNTAAFFEFSVGAGSVAKQCSFFMEDASGNTSQEWDAQTADYSGLHLFEVTVDVLGNVSILVDGVNSNAISQGGPNLPLQTISSGELVVQPSFNFITGSNSYIYEQIAWSSVLSSGSQTAIRQNIATYYGVVLS